MKKATLLLLLFLQITWGFSQKTKFVTKNRGASITILSRKIPDNMPSHILSTSPAVGLYYNYRNTSFDDLTDSLFIGIDSGYYKCNTEETLVLIENPNLKSETQLVQMKEIRAGKKRVVLKSLEYIQKRKVDDSFIEIENVAIKINKKGYIQKYYESTSDFSSNNVEHIYISDNEIMVKNSILEEYLNHFLIKNNYLDTSGKLNLNIYDKINLDITINSIIEHKFSYFCVVEVKTTVKFPPTFGSIKERNFVTKSFIGYDNSKENEANNRSLVANALENLILEMVKDPELSNLFKNPEKELKKKTESLDEIVIMNKSIEVSNLETTTNNVVTVVQKNGHGSGCIVSNNCYILTNYHVTGIDTSEIYVIFNSGVKKRCRFIRGNPIYDLALLQVDTTIASPININLSKNINIGADIYAIGTPQDISLGQSVAKGIISAKRKIENKIYIQSDVSVNSGNSGGAMVNKEGELIAIVNAKLVGNNVEGVSFAIPIYYIEEALKLRVEK